jgi:hypothetical protein
MRGRYRGALTRCERVENGEMMRAEGEQWGMLVRTRNQAELVAARAKMLL